MTDRLPDLTAPATIGSGIGATLGAFNITGLEAVLQAVDTVAVSHLPNTLLITTELGKIDGIIGGIKWCGHHADSSIERTDIVAADL